MPHRPDLLRALASLAVEERSRHDAGDDHGVVDLDG